MTTIEQLKDRLTRLAARREMEGNYTDEMLCIKAVELIGEMEECLNEAVNFIDHTHTMLTAVPEMKTHAEHTRAMCLKSINFGLETNERGEAA